MNNYTKKSLPPCLAPVRQMKNISLILSVLTFELASLAFLPVVKADVEYLRPTSMSEQKAVGKSARFYRYLGIASGELGVDGKPLVQGYAMRQKQLKIE